MTMPNVSWKQGLQHKFLICVLNSDLRREAWGGVFFILYSKFELLSQL